MRFMIIVKASHDSEAGVMPSEQLLTDMGNYNEQLAKAGILVSADGLHPSSKGARVRFSGENRSVIDGPFVDTKEQLGGFRIIDVSHKVSDAELPLTMRTVSPKPASTVSRPARPVVVKEVAKEKALEQVVRLIARSADAVVAEPEPVGPERVGLDDVRARAQVALVDGADQSRVGQVELGQRPVERGAGRVQHGAHRAVADQHALPGQRPAFCTVPVPFLTRPISMETRMLSLISSIPTPRKSRGGSITMSRPSSSRGTRRTSWPTPRAASCWRSTARPRRRCPTRTTKQVTDQSLEPCVLDQHAARHLPA